MSRNLIKTGGFMPNAENNKRVIDTNSLMAKKLEILKDVLGDQYIERNSGNDSDEMTEGLDAEQVAALLEDDNGSVSNLIKSEPVHQEPAVDIEAMKAAAQEEIDSMKQKAADEIELLKKNTLQKAHDEGYQAGFSEGSKKAEALEAIQNQREQDLNQREQQMQTSYEEQCENLEPQMVDTLIRIYEHIFKVEIREHRDLILQLLSNALHKVEGSKDYIIHVSKEDYPFVSMQKKQLLEGLSAQIASAEIIEDLTLKQNECFIETDGGIYDCSLGTQLEELAKKIRILSYETD